jgi:hypothetical protein
MWSMSCSIFPTSFPFLSFSYLMIIPKASVTGTGWNGVPCPATGNPSSHRYPRAFPADTPVLVPDENEGYTSCVLVESVAFRGRRDTCHAHRIR